MVPLVHLHKPAAASVCWAGLLTTVRDRAVCVSTESFFPVPAVGLSRLGTSLEKQPNTRDGEEHGGRTGLSEGGEICSVG